MAGEFLCSATIYTKFSVDNWYWSHGSCGLLLISFLFLQTCAQFICHFAHWTTSRCSFVSTVHLTPFLTLFDVLHVPNFSLNLISASKLTSHSHCCLLFQNNSCIIQDLRSWMFIGVARQNKGLYYMNLVDVPAKATPPSTICNLSTLVDSETWNNLLGHLSDARLKLLHKHMEKWHLSSKQRGLSFATSNSMSLLPFDLIHVDIWGLITMPSLYGHLYFLTIIDDFNRSIWVFLMKSKSEARPLLLNFTSYIETQFLNN